MLAVFVSFCLLISQDAAGYLRKDGHHQTAAQGNFCALAGPPLIVAAVPTVRADIPWVAFLWQYNL